MYSVVNIEAGRILVDQIILEDLLSCARYISRVIKELLDATEEAQGHKFTWQEYERIGLPGLTATASADLSGIQNYCRWISDFTNGHVWVLIDEAVPQTIDKDGRFHERDE